MKAKINVEFTWQKRHVAIFV